MNNLQVIIERAEHNYSAYVDGLDGITVTGNTIDEIKCNMASALSDYADACRECGCEVPEELCGDYSLSFRMDVRSFLNFYNDVFSKSGLERLTGINQKQLWHYASGGRRPRPEQALRMEKALHKLGEELLSISL